MSGGLKRAAVIEDLSGFGRCALTIALPVLAVSGIEAVPLPTAVLSSHMGLPDPAITDLTESLLPAAEQYHRLQVAFDGVYVGYLAGEHQLDVVRQMLPLLRQQNTLFLLDPVMGDHGRLYRSVTPGMAGKMQDLCREAHILTPNMTEAAALLGMPLDAVQTPEQAGQAAEALCRAGARTVMVTGVRQDGRIGTMIARRGVPGWSYISAPCAHGAFHGTGDLFASVLLAGLLNGASIPQSAQLAVDFVARCVAKTAEAGTLPAGGLLFEPELLHLGHAVKSV